MDDLGRLETRIDYIFNDRDLLALAMTHRSSRRNNNERLEYLGDSILGCVIAEALYHQFPKSPEGDLTKMRAKLVRGTTLASLARKIGIKDFLILGEGEMKSGGFNRDSILSDAVEAMFGAIYLDGGFRIARSIIMTLMADRLVSVNPQNLKDNKTRLQEIIQAQNQPLPDYEVINQAGKAHALTFTVECRIDHPQSPFVATGNSRRVAEQQAASLAINALIDGSQKGASSPDSEQSPAAGARDDSSIGRH